MDAIAGIYARELPSVDRYVQLGVASDKLVHCSFPESPDEEATGEHELLDRVERVVEDGEPDDFADVEIGLTVPTDQRAVLERLREVRPGETVDVPALARMTPSLDDEDEDREVVRRALRGNPIRLVLPDHRVDGIEGATPGEVRRRLREVEGLSG